jgi:REP-associated tyrosine transposase
MRRRLWCGRCRAAPRVPGAEFRHLFGFAKVLWSPSYFAASVDYVSESMVRRFVEHQWDEVAS